MAATHLKKSMIQYQQSWVFFTFFDLWLVKGLYLDHSKICIYLLVLMVTVQLKFPVPQTYHQRCRDVSGSLTTNWMVPLLFSLDDAAAFQMSIFLITEQFSILPQFILNESRSRENSCMSGSCSHMAPVLHDRAVISIYGWDSEVCSQSFLRWSLLLMISCTVDDEIFLTILCWELSWNCSTICRCSFLSVFLWIESSQWSLLNYVFFLYPIILWTCCQLAYLVANLFLQFFLLVSYLSLFQSVLKLFFDVIKLKMIKFIN